MSEPSEIQQLVDAAAQAIGQPRVVRPEEFESIAALATAAVLRTLSELAEQAEERGVDWPDAGDLELLADELDPPNYLDIEEPR